MSSNCNLISFSLFVILCFRICSTCPSECACKWKHGKETAECVNKGLVLIPAGINAGTQVLDASQNNFSDIPTKAFQRAGLVNLQKIFMNQCAITRIAADAFFQLSNLIELDLSRNKLKTVPSNALSLCPNLRRLQIAHNPITIIESGAFSSMSHLTFLGLSNCQIEHIQLGAFSGLEKLDHIELDGNRINTLSIDIFPVSYLFGLQLHNNPWHCDCSVREIRTWMMEHNIPLSVPPHCESPAYLKGFTWNVLSLEDFACVPTMFNLPTELKVIAGHNVSIHCQVTSIPKGSIYWEVDGRSLKNISSSPELKSKYNIEGDQSLSHQSSVLTIYNVVDADSDVYSCLAENKAGISSINFTLSVLCPNHFNGTWNNLQITLLLFGIISVIILCAAIICLLVYHPVSFQFDSKLNRKNVLQNTQHDNPEKILSSENKEEKALEKHPRHETGSSGYGSDQLTPDLVSKISDLNNGPPLSLSYNHLSSDTQAVYDGCQQWPHVQIKTPKYDGPSPVVYSEIYLNPCYGKDNDVSAFALQSSAIEQLSDCAVLENDRVRTLRGVYDSNRDDMYMTSAQAERRYPLVAFAPKNTFSPDEGYAEEGTEV